MMWDQWRPPAGWPLKLPSGTAWRNLRAVAKAAMAGAKSTGKAGLWGGEVRWVGEAAMVPSPKVHRPEPKEAKSA